MVAIGLRGLMLMLPISGFSLAMVAIDLLGYGINRKFTERFHSVAFSSSLYSLISKRSDGETSGENAEPFFSWFSVFAGFFQGTSRCRICRFLYCIELGHSTWNQRANGILWAIAWFNQATGLVSCFVANVVWAESQFLSHGSLSFDFRFLSVHHANWV